MIGRRWSNFSLASYIALCLIASVFLGLNIRISVSHSGRVGIHSSVMTFRGFPFACYWEYYIDGKPAPDVCEREGWAVPDFVNPSIEKLRLTANIVCGAMAALAGGLVTEWLVRRKSRADVAVSAHCTDPNSSPPPPVRDGG